MTRRIDTIVVHCSATPNGRWTTAPDIDRWHDDRGFERRDHWRERFNPEYKAIGYHFVIYTDGTVVTGRHLDEVGAHASGHNARSIGICMIGTSAYTLEQWRALDRLVAKMRTSYPAAKILGHRDLPEVHKTCPGFDVATWLAREGNVPEEWVLTLAAD